MTGKQMLQEHLQNACATLYIRPGTVITPADRPALEMAVDTAMASHGWQLDEVVIELHDDDEMATVRVRNGLATAELTLGFETADGRAYAVVDVDGDGA